MIAAVTLVRLFFIAQVYTFTSMNLVKIIDSSVGQKIIAGTTGLALVGFLLVHMGGNLQIFAGADALNEYAVLLKSSALVLWTARLALFSLITLHIAMTVRRVFGTDINEADGMWAQSFNGHLDLRVQ